MYHLPLLHKESPIRLPIPNYIHSPINQLNSYNHNYKLALNVTNLILFPHINLKHTNNSF